MIKIFGDTEEIAATKPTKPSTAGKVLGYFQHRNLATGAVPTTLYAWFLNMLQDEILSALTACGITPSASSDAQLGDCFDKKANRAGDTFTGDVAFQGAVSFEAAESDSVGFDEEIEFYRTIPAISGVATGASLPTYPDGAIVMSENSARLLIPLPSFVGTRLKSVEFLVAVGEGAEATQITLSIERSSLYQAIGSSISQEQLAYESHALNNTLVRESVTIASPGEMYADSAIPTAHGHRYYFAQARITTYNAPVSVYGVRVTYLRQRVAV